MWTKCEQCGEIIHKTELEQNLFTCGKCNTHFRIGSREYIQVLLDEGSFKEHDRQDAFGRPAPVRRHEALP